MISKKHSMTITFSSLVVMGLLASQPAAATDDKTYPDFMCKPLAGQAKFFSGTANIDPNADHSVNCPIVRDAVLPEDGGELFITVVDESLVSDVSCAVFTSRPSGEVLKSGSTKSSGASSSPQTPFHILVGVGFDVNSHLRCSIPRATPNGSGGYRYSYVVSYRLNEN